MTLEKIKDNVFKDLITDSHIAKPNDNEIRFRVFYNRCRRKLVLITTVLNWIKKKKEIDSIVLKY